MLNQINSQNNGFYLKLPIGFVSKRLDEKYSKVLQALPTPYKNTLDYLNSTIQNITFPEMSMENPEQFYKFGDSVSMKSSELIDELFDKDITITFKSTDGYLNYWIVFEIILEYISWINKEKFLGNIIITNTNAHGFSYANIIMKRITFSSLSGNEFNFTDNTSDLQNFDLNLKFNDIEFNILNESIDLNYGPC